VAVCGTKSIFLNSIRSPTRTWIDAGENFIPSIEILCVTPSSDPGERRHPNVTTATAQTRTSAIVRNGDEWARADSAGGGLEVLGMVEMRDECGSHFDE
jgi:hypothetical protein